MIPDNVRTLFGKKTVKIGWAADALAAFVQNVSIDHCRSNVTMAQEFLHGADVVTGFDEVGGEAVPERVSGDSFRDIALSCCGANCLGNRWFSVMEISVPGDWDRPTGAPCVRSFWGLRCASTPATLFEFVIACITPRFWGRGV